mgnify:CR=1 FL=1
MELQEIRKGVFVRKTSPQSARAESGGQSKKGGPFHDESELEAVCAEEWRRSAALRQEFSGLAAYTAFRKAYAAGQVGIFGERTARG